MPTHSVSVTLDKTNAVYDTLTTIRNPSDNAVSADIFLPMRGNRVNWPQLNGWKMTASVDGAPVKLTEGRETKTAPDEKSKRSGIVAKSYSRSDTLALTFKPKQTHSLKVRYIVPLGIAGLDGMQRMVIYDTTGARNWVGGIGHWTYSIHYPKNLIVQVFAALPQGAWQVGDTGAFTQARDFTTPEKPHWIFTYYPNTL